MACASSGGISPPPIGKNMSRIGKTKLTIVFGRWRMSGARQGWMTIVTGARFAFGSFMVGGVECVRLGRAAEMAAFGYATGRISDLVERGNFGIWKLHRLRRRQDSSSRIPQRPAAGEKGGSRTLRSISRFKRPL